MNLPILEFLFQCYFLYKRHTHFSTLSVYTVIFNPIIITWYTLYTTINCTPFYDCTYPLYYSTNSMSIPENSSSLIQLSFSITRTDNSTSSSSSMCFIDLRISSMTFSLLSLWNIQSRFVSSIEIDCPYSYISLCVFFDFS